MPRIQEEVTSYSWELLLRFLGISGEALANMERALEFTVDTAGKLGGKAVQASRGVLNLLIDNARKRAERNEPGADSDAGALAKMGKRVDKNHETLRTLNVADEELERMTRKLRESDVLFITLDIAEDDSKCIVYLSGDDYAVNKAIRSFMADRGLVNEMDPEEFLDTMTKDGVGTMDGLDSAELEAFREYARKESLPFAKISTDEDHHIIVYELERSKDVKGVMAAAIFALSGERGEDLRRALSAEAASRKTLYKALEDREEHVIVSVKNRERFVVLDDHEAILYKDGKRVADVSRENAQFFEKALQMADGLGESAVLDKVNKNKNRKEYSLNGSRDEIRLTFHDEVLQEKIKDKVPDEKLRDYFEEQNERRRLVEEKMALDDENQNPFWVFDGGYTYSDATVHEGIDDRDDDREEEIEDIDRVKRRLSALEIEETAATAPRGIDAIIAQAEQRKAENIKGQKEKETEEKGFRDI